MESVTSYHSIIDDAGDHTGTFPIYFEVEYERSVTANNSTTTETVRQRYTAILKVESTQSFEHVPAGTLDGQRQDAENWSVFAGSVRKIAGEDANLEEQTQLAINLLRLRHRPFEALSGEFSGMLVALAVTLGGLMVLALLGGLHLLSRYSDIKYINRIESLKSEEHAIDEKLSELNLRERKRALQNMDWWDVFEDDVRARAFRDAFGETVFDGVVRLQTLLLPTNIIHDRLQAMGQAGWVAAVERDDVATDGGDSEVDVEPVGRILSAELVRDGEVPDDREAVDLQDPTDELVEAIDWNDRELRSFDLPKADLDAEQLSTSAQTMTLEELMEAVDEQRRDFETPEEFGRLLAEFIESVRAHEFTDEHGAVRELRYTLNQFLQMSQLVDDREGVPIFEFLGDAVERQLIDDDPVEDARVSSTTLRPGGTHDR